MGPTYAYDLRASGVDGRSGASLPASLRPLSTAISSVGIPGGGSPPPAPVHPPAPTPRLPAVAMMGLLLLSGDPGSSSAGLALVADRTPPPMLPWGVRIDTEIDMPGTTRLFSGCPPSTEREDRDCR